jgi:hypothetical protein
MATRGKQLLIALAILLLAEGVAYLLLERKGIAFPFLLQPQGLIEKPQDLFGIGYDEVDPLLGWGMSKNGFNERGYTVAHTMPVLVSDSSCNGDTISILITGGSTADLVFEKESWPIDLVRMLRDSGMCAKVYVGAVGAYSSGQEVLKLLRDGLMCRPDIHISYSGANEMYSPSFVSSYEMDVFKRIMETRSTVLFPNLAYVIRRKIGMVSRLRVHHSTPADAATFWMDNMQTMYAVAEQRGYRFIGVLQPVLGIGKTDQPKEMDEWADMIGDYRTFYPIAIDHSLRQPYLVNLTGMFDTVSGPVYVDDCHLRPEKQPIVASEILKLILQHIDSRHTDTDYPD